MEPTWTHTSISGARGTGSSRPVEVWKWGDVDISVTREARSNTRRCRDPGRVLFGDSVGHHSPARPLPTCKLQHPLVAEGCKRLELVHVVLYLKKR